MAHETPCPKTRADGDMPDRVAYVEITETATHTPRILVVRPDDPGHTLPPHITIRI